MGAALDWRRMAREVVEAFDEDSGSAPRPASVSRLADPEAVLERQRDILLSFWEGQAEQFSKYINELSQEELEGFIRSVSPFTPTSIANPTCTVDGKAYTLLDIAVLLPELCMQQLVAEQGEGLLKLFRQRAEQVVRIRKERAEDTDGSLGDSLLVDYLDAQDQKWVERRIADGLLMRKTPEYAIVNIRGPNRGQMLEFTNTSRAALAKREQLIALGRGTVLDADVWVYLRQRQSLILTTLLQLAKAFKEDVLGASNAAESRRFLRTLGCAQCGQHKAAGGQPLKLCSLCNRAMYCGRECQRRHWHTHKHDCKLWRQQKPEKQQGQHEAKQLEPEQEQNTTQQDQEQQQGSALQQPEEGS